MSALATVQRAVVSSGETPSCRICRRSRSANPGELLCTERRSPAPQGVVFLRVPITWGEPKLRNDNRMAEELAARCKFYQEEQ